MPAPIALFVYDRPVQTESTLELLRRNARSAESDLIVFSDGARSAANEAGVAATRALLADVRGFRSVRVVTRPENLGLAGSISAGVTEVLREHDRVIVLEDDMLTSPQFLDYMNAGLDRFAGDARVGSIHAYMYPIEGLPPYFFIRGGDCWGWATWRDRWTALWEPDGRLLLRRLRERGLLRAFDRTGGSDNLAMLLEQIRGRNSSWFIRWHAALFLAGKLTLQPGRSFIHNIGVDASGTHGVTTNVFDVVPQTSFDGLPEQAIEEDRGATDEIARFFDRVHGRRWPQRAVRYILNQIRLRVVLHG
jgi:hypothetical protein